MSSLNTIKKYLEKMSFSNQEKFLKLIIKNNIPFSENKNGSFINISELNSSQINIINQFISLLELEEYSFNEVEKTKQLLKNLINDNIETDNSQQYDLNILS
tara:strand:+ start:271 stop:576 length:306 start_codon:yes stop_codon:yes gene_type:complete